MPPAAVSRAHSTTVRSLPGRPNSDSKVAVFARPHHATYHNLLSSYLLDTTLVLSGLFADSSLVLRGRWTAAGLGDVQQLEEVIFPEHGAVVRLVAAGLVAKRNQNVAAAPHFCYLAFQDAELGRVDFIIGRIDSEQRRLDFFEHGRGTVIGRGFI